MFLRLLTRPSICSAYESLNWNNKERQFQFWAIRKALMCVVYKHNIFFVVHVHDSYKRKLIMSRTAMRTEVRWLSPRICYHFNHKSAKVNNLILKRESIDIRTLSMIVKLKNAESGYQRPSQGDLSILFIPAAINMLAPCMFLKLDWFAFRTRQKSAYTELHYN